MIKNETTYDESEDRIIVKTSYDNQSILDENKALRNSAPETGRYKKNFAGLTHVAKIHEGDVVRLKNMGYDLLSPDPDEWKRCLLYIQQNEPYLLTVPGKPISKKRLIWS